jgi:SAM-dependent methyltransferase
MRGAIAGAVAALLVERRDVLRGRVVDVGCGRAPYRSLLEGVDYVGVDSDPGVGPDVVADARSLPFPDESVDAVLCVSLLEATEDPFAAVSEFARILRSGGHLVVVASQGWRQLAAVDYFRFTADGLRLLTERVGLEVLDVGVRGGFLAQLGAKLATYGGEILPLIRRPLAVVERVLVALDRRFTYERDPLLVQLLARKP